MTTRNGALALIAGLLFAPVAALAADKPCTSLEQGKSAALPLDPSNVYIRDGDTIEERKGCIPAFRFSDVDTPEPRKKKSEYKCPKEKDRGIKATCRLTELIRTAQNLEFDYSGETDKFGRALGKLMIDGKSAGEILRGEGLGCPTKDERNDWCSTPPKCLAQP